MHTCENTRYAETATTAKRIQNRRVSLGRKNPRILVLITTFLKPSAAISRHAQKQLPSVLPKSGVMPLPPSEDSVAAKGPRGKLPG